MPPAAHMEEIHSDPDSNGFDLSSHQTMLEDKSRLRLMTKAIKEVVKPGDVVVDAATGTGILAFLAHRCGAKRVIGIDASPVVEFAREVKAANFPDANIEFHKMDLRRGRLPKVKADVILCELLGYFGFDEGIVAVMARLRRQMLKPKGRMLPSRFDQMIAPVQGKSLYDGITYWKRAYDGMDFSPYQQLSYNSVYMFADETPTRLAMPQCISSIDCLTINRLPKRQRATFRFTRAGNLHGFVGWFTADLSAQTHITTSPWKRGTHWHQVFFPIGEPVRVSKGGEASFELVIDGDPLEVPWQWRGTVTPRKTGGRIRTFDLQTRA